LRPIEERGRRPGAVGALAFGPAGLVLLVELLALLYAALGGARRPVEAAIYALWAGAIAGLAGPLAIILLRRRDRLVWVVASVAATLVALLLSFAVWAGAADVACHGAADCPFG
jgi:hypothetical protein